MLSTSSLRECTKVRGRCALCKCLYSLEERQVASYPTATHVSSHARAAVPRTNTTIRANTTLLKLLTAAGGLSAANAGTTRCHTIRLKMLLKKTMHAIAHGHKLIFSRPVPYSLLRSLLGNTIAAYACE